MARFAGGSRAAMLKKAPRSGTPHMWGKQEGCGGGVSTAARRAVMLVLEEGLGSEMQSPHHCKDLILL